MPIRADRRTVLASLGAAAGTLAAPGILRAQQLFATYPFMLGVASGEPAADGFVIWTRLAPDPLGEHGGMVMKPMEVAWEVATDEQMRATVARGTAVARPELGHSVHVEVAGLEPARPYFYRFAIGGERSPRGRAVTLPAAGSRPERVRFAVAGCQHYEQGLYTAHRYMAREMPDFVFCYGDYIYEGPAGPVSVSFLPAPAPIVRRHVGQEIYDLADYRRRYSQYRMDPDLQAAHAAAPWFVSFDDHEVDNNWAAGIEQDGTAPELFALRKAAALQAWYEFMPVRRSALPGPNMVTWRRARLGDLMALHVCDTRSFRSDQPCGDGFKAPCDEVRRPDATIFGAAQERWLEEGLRAGGTRWQALAQQIMVMPLSRPDWAGSGMVRNLDSWGGYDAPRARLVQMLGRAGNAVVLTGDEHQHFAGTLLSGGAEGRPMASEFVATSISSGGDGNDRRFDADGMQAANPFLKHVSNRRGYLLCDVTQERWETAMRAVDSVSQPGAPLRTIATATVTPGNPEPVLS